MEDVVWDVVWTLFGTLLGGWLKFCLGCMDVVRSL